MGQDRPRKPRQIVGYRAAGAAVPLSEGKDEGPDWRTTEVPEPCTLEQDYESYGGHASIPGVCGKPQPPAAGSGRAAGSGEASLRHDEWVSKYAAARLWSQRLRTRGVRRIIRQMRQDTEPFDGETRLFDIPGRKEGRKVTFLYSMQERLASRKPDRHGDEKRRGPQDSKTSGGAVLGHRAPAARRSS